jgi:hypothetical protein
MTSFIDIPINDIKDFLIFNNKPVTTSPHLDAWNLLKNDKSLTVPPSISDFFLAQNLINENIPQYKISQILTSDVKDLIFITSLQNIPKNRIIRVLKYLNKLENDLNIFDFLPKDISNTVISDIDIHSAQLICEISENFSKFCRDHLQSKLKQNLKCKMDINVDNLSLKQILNYSSKLKDNARPNDYFQSLILKNNKIYDKNDITIPIYEQYFHDIIQLAVSDNHALALNAEGDVYVLGNNTYGQLGLGHYFDCEIPQLINDIVDVTCVSVSDNYSMLLTASGDVYVTGNTKLNTFQKLEIEDIIQISAGNSYMLALSANGKVYIINDTNIKVLLDGINIISISTSYNHSLLLDKYGLVYAYGDNNYGQLGVNDKYVNVPSIMTGLYDVVSVVAGNKYSLILTSNGNVFKFGLHDDEINYSPIKINIPDIIEC